MTSYVTHRVLTAVLVILLISVIISAILFFGNPAENYILIDPPLSGTASERQEAMDAIKSAFGLDTPVIIRYANWYARWIGDVFRGDLGQSWYGASYYD